MIGQSLRDQTIQMGLYEMENLLNRCWFMQVQLLGCLSAILLFSICQSGLGESSLSPPFLYITGFEKLWWNLGRSIARI